MIISMDFIHAQKNGAPRPACQQEAHIQQLPHDLTWRPGAPTTGRGPAVTRRRALFRNTPGARAPGPMISSCTAT